MDFDYDSLAVLSAVIRTGSFETAAKSLNVTQSAVSQRIKQLEEKVGSILIVRGRPCVPTEDGLLLCQHVEQVTLLRHEVSEQLSGPVGVSRANVRIAVNSDSLATWFPKVVKHAADELNLRLDIIPDDQEFTEDRLRSGDATAVITSSVTPIAGCKSYALGEMEYLAVASKSYAENHLTAGITLANVASGPSIRFDRKDTLPLQWLQVAFGNSAVLSSHYIPSYEGHMLCCRLGIGWAMMPHVAVAALVDSGELIDVVPDARVRVPLFWHTRSQSSRIMQGLSEIVLRVAKTELDGNGR
ncbi:LysR family transcriptional regulator ArgP [Puniceibacterium sp. IMCC21224]|uniref:LysR family transcriptional regulator ArgP n=1 Tax=Puniceibacterium sp. IMCC21224 TaxID=1618204 RepID=UPI00064DD4E3|nr:LysR family transcriptional regulator ArgP [Puniceibacterium sp. IMCC21224]KMK64814.1 transcriptional regulator, ArgP family [Puniceibacterium sp. IMCC21224]